MNRQPAINPCVLIQVFFLFTFSDRFQTKKYSSSECICWEYQNTALIHMGVYDISKVHLNLQPCGKLCGLDLIPMGLHGGADAWFPPADHLFLMAKECQNEEAPVCGCTNHAENLLPAASRHFFFLPAFPHQILSEGFPGNHSKCLISP